MVTVSDFRSDTVTRPSEAMRRAMAEAPVGDDVLDGDPSVRELERAAAEWLGMEGALFVPSGSMANQVAVGSWVRPGEQVILDDETHIVRWEAGAASALFGAQIVTLPARRGVLIPGEIRGVLRPATTHSPKTALVCVEQTHGESGGFVVPLASIEAVGRLAREEGIPVHMDGARLANAVVASGVPAAQYTAHVDSVSMCFSKGLGAPVGSVVAGDTEFLARARVVRKRLGGWMRQAGVIAAPARLALERGVERLVDDHRLAASVARVIDAHRGLDSPPENVETNIVMVEIAPELGDADSLAAKLAARGVLALPMAAQRLRFVTHVDVGPRDLEQLREALDAILST